MALVARYEYRTPRGAVAFLKHRYEPKRFSYHRPNGSAVEANLLPKLLYRLPDLIAADPNLPVFIVEGEKDVETLTALGLVTTCNYDGGGHGKWLPKYGRYFRGRDVVVIPDNDRTGSEHARDVARHLSNKARSVRVLELPALPPKGDVSDWLGNCGTRAQLFELAAATPLWRQHIKLSRPRDDEYSVDWTLRWALEEILPMNLSAPEKLLLIVLKAKIEQPKPTQRTLAAVSGLSLRRTKKLLQELRKRNIISTSKVGRENVYYVHNRGRL